jgi:hypothetical protein
MSIKAKISVDNSELKQGLQQAEQQAQKTGKAIGKSVAGNGASEALDKLGKNADNAVRALDSVSGAAGGASTGLSGLAGDIIELVRNPMAALIAALGALVAIGVKVWDKLTESAEEYFSKLEILSKQNQFEESRYTQEVNAVDSLIEILINLNNTYVDMVGIQDIIKTSVKELESYYGKLGVQIDKDTGKIKNLAEILLQINKLQQEKNVGNAVAAVTVAQKKADVQANKAFGEMGLNEGAVTNRSGWDTFWGKYSTGLNTKFNLSKIQTVEGAHGARREVEISDEELEARKAWNESNVNDGYRGKIKYLTWKLKKSTDQDEIDEISKLIQSLNELAKKDEEFSNITGTGAKNRTEEIAKWAEKGSKFNDARTQGWDNTLRMELEKYRLDTKAAYDSGTNSDRINIKSKELAGLKKQHQITGKIAEAQNKAVIEAQEEYDKFMKSKEAGIKKRGYALPEEWKTQQQLEQNVINAREKMDAAHQKHLSSSRELLSVQQEIAKLNENQTKFYSDIEIGLSREIEMNELLLAGKYEEIEILRLENQIKDKGLKIDQKAIREITYKRKQLAGLKFDQSIAEDYQKMELQAMRAAGLEREAAFLEAKRNREKQLGRKLTEDQLQQLKKMIDLQFDLNNLSGYRMMLRGEKTNELTARGGFRGGAVTDRNKDVNWQILQQSRMANAYLQEIKKNGVIR